MQTADPSPNATCPPIPKPVSCPTPPQQMYDLVADVEQYPEFLPWCAAARIRQTTQRGESTVMEADLVISFKVFRERFGSRVMLWPEDMRIDTEYLDGPFKYMKSELGVRRGRGRLRGVVSRRFRIQEPRCCRASSAWSSTRRCSGSCAPSNAGRGSFTDEPVPRVVGFRAERHARCGGGRGARHHAAVALRLDGVRDRGGRRARGAHRSGHCAWTKADRGLRGSSAVPTRCHLAGRRWSMARRAMRSTTTTRISPISATRRLPCSPPRLRWRAGARGADALWAALIGAEVSVPHRRLARPRPLPDRVPPDRDRGRVRGHGRGGSAARPRSGTDAGRPRRWPPPARPG